MLGIERLEDGPNQRTKAVIEPGFARIKTVVLINQPIGVFGSKRAYGYICHGMTMADAFLPFNPDRASTRLQLPPEMTMGINKESDIEANLQIGPTDAGMVRIYVEAKGVEIPMDFDPEEADEIADEIKAAAKAAGAMKR